jgi:hypothetical protein
MARGPSGIPGLPRPKGASNDGRFEVVKVFWFFFSKKNCFLPFLD